MKDAGVVHLYPSVLARNAALDAACRGAESGVAWADARLTFGQFVARLERSLPRAPRTRVLGHAGRFALLAEAWQRAAPDSPPSRGAVEALGALVASFKAMGATPKTLTKAAPKEHAAVFTFLSKAWAAYEDGLKEPWTDREGWELQLLERLRQSDENEALPKRLVIHGQYRLDPFQRALLLRLRELGVGVEISAALGESEDPQNGFARSFGALATEVRPGAPPPVIHVQRVEAPTAYSEAYEIGRRVRRWIVEDGVAPETVAVVYRDLGPYSQFLADVFTRFHIPFYERRGEPAAFQPLVRAALAALDAVRSGLPREALFRFLRSGPVDASALAGEAADPHALHRLALDARIDRFFGADAQQPAEAWRKRLNEHLKRIGAGNRMPRVAEAPRHAKALKTIVEKLAQLGGRASSQAFAERWRAFFEASGMLQPHVDESGLAARRTKEAARALGQALDDAAEGPLAGKAIAFDTFAELFVTAILGASVIVDGGDRAEGVRILNLYDVRGLRFQRLVLGGMNEGVFPAPSSSDPILGSLDPGAIAALRANLERASPDLAPFALCEPRQPEEVRQEERALLALACRALEPGGMLLLARCFNAADGRHLGPSIFWDEPGFAGRPVELAEPVRPAPALRECISGEEAELRAAWVLGGGGGADRVREAALAAALTGRAGRLHEAARRANIEENRERFFERFAAEAGTEDPQIDFAEEFDGVLSQTAPEVGEQMRQRLLADAQSENRLSPSSLETHAQCAFQFLSDRIYRIGETEEPGEELAPLDRGTLWHRILASFYGELLKEAQREGRVVVCLDPARRAAYLDRLGRAAREALDAAPQERFTGHPGFWRLQREAIEREMGAWLECELAAAQAEGAFHPAFVELDFGLKGQAPAVEIALGQELGGLVRLEGRIDRLDLRVADPLDNPPTVTAIRVLDYKLGGLGKLKEAAKIERIRKLLNAQVPVYFQAAFNYLNKLANDAGWEVCWDTFWTESQAGYYTLRNLHEIARAQDSPVVLCKDKTILKLRETLGLDKSLDRLIQQSVAAMLAGRFAVAPQECQGIYCAARFACRYREMPAEPAAGDADA